MTTLTELIALADAATPKKGKRLTYYDGAWDISDQEQTLYREANPATVKRMAELLKQCREALEDYRYVGVYKPQIGCSVFVSNDALAALDAFEKEGK